MKPYNEQEFNRLCAEFLKFKKVLAHEEDKYSYIQTVDGYLTCFSNTTDFLQLIEMNDNNNIHSISQLKFHSDWNWIMEVVEKIESLGHQVDIIGNEIRIDSNVKAVRNITTGGTMNSYNQTYHLTLISVTEENYSKKEAVVQAIWQFLNWYNEQKNGKQND